MKFSEEKIIQDNERFTNDELLFREGVDRSFALHSSANKIMERIKSVPVPQKPEEPSLLEKIWYIIKLRRRVCVSAFVLFIATLFVVIMLMGEKESSKLDKKNISLISIKALNQEAMCNDKHVEDCFIENAYLSLLKSIDLTGEFNIKVSGQVDLDMIASGQMKLELISEPKNSKFYINIKGDSPDIKLNKNNNIEILVNNKEYVLESKKGREANKNKVAKTIDNNSKRSVVKRKRKFASDTLRLNSEKVKEIASSANLINKIESLPIVKDTDENKAEDAFYSEDAYYDTASATIIHEDVLSNAFSEGNIEIEK